MVHLSHYDCQHIIKKNRIIQIRWQKIQNKNNYMDTNVRKYAHISYTIPIYRYSRASVQSFLYDFLKIQHYPIL